jgi:hypothetical protein
MNNTEPNKTQEWTQVLVKDKQFLPLIDTRHIFFLRVIYI